MKLKSLTSLAWPQFVLRTMAACGLNCALFLPGAASPVLAAGVSDDAVSLAGGNMSSEGVYHFSFEAKAGQAYPIGVSADLVYWSLLTNVVGEGGLLWVTDLEAPKFPQRFYQVGVPLTPTNMVFVRPGTFTMGSPESEASHDANEGPQTVVTLSRGFWIGKCEVSQAEFVAVMGANNSHFRNPGLPVDGATWVMATDYCHALTERERAAGRLPTGHIYRLPTEAEWEYACRARTTTPFGIADGTSLGSAQANFDGTFPFGEAASGPFLNKTTLVGHYLPNAWGLYDMHGNVWEWCQDWYGPYPGGKATDPKGPAKGSERVLRGGGYTSLGQSCRSARRDRRSPGFANRIQGFRVVLAPNP